MSRRNRRRNNDSGRPVKAYNNTAFLNSADARTLRILSEYLEPMSRFRRHRIRDFLVFFGSARSRSREEILPRFEEAKRLFESDRGNPDYADDFRRMELALKFAEYYESCRELSRRLTEWALALPGPTNRFVICSGGGPGMMEAANRGAEEAGGLSVGLNISLPFEQQPNPYISKGLSVEFHYFFMRKLWFVYYAKALVVFPGGFGTLDEMMETLTLIQTRKVRKQMPFVLFGSEFWKDVINFDGLLKWGAICPKDLELFQIHDSVDDAFDYLTAELTRLHL